MTSATTLHLAISAEKAKKGVADWNRLTKQVETSAKEADKAAVRLESSFKKSAGGVNAVKSAYEPFIRVQKALDGAMAKVHQRERDLAAARSSAISRTERYAQSLRSVRDVLVGVSRVSGRVLSVFGGFVALTSLFEGVSSAVGNMKDNLSGAGDEMERLVGLQAELAGSRNTQANVDQVDRQFRGAFVSTDPLLRQIQRESLYRNAQRGGSDPNGGALRRAQAIVDGLEQPVRPIRGPKSFRLDFHSERTGRSRLQRLQAEIRRAEAIAQISGELFDSMYKGRPDVPDPTALDARRFGPGRLRELGGSFLTPSALRSIRSGANVPAKYGLRNILKQSRFDAEERLPGLRRRESEFLSALQRTSRPSPAGKKGDLVQSDAHIQSQRAIQQALAQSYTDGQSAVRDSKKRIEEHTQSLVNQQAVISAGLDKRQQTLTLIRLESEARRLKQPLDADAVAKAVAEAKSLDDLNRKRREQVEAQRAKREADLEQQRKDEERKQKQEALRKAESEQWKSLGRTITESVGGALERIGEKGVKMKDIFRDLYRDVGRIGLRFFTQQLGNSLFPKAMGDAFSGGNPIPFASGGVVGAPTLFGMGGGRTGLMGEAGPEAIMPLKRTRSGKLGVETDGGGSATVVNNFSYNISTPDVGGFGYAQHQLLNDARDQMRRMGA